MRTVTGWGYWITCTIIGTAEITAAGIYVQYWFPEILQWVTALTAVVGLVSLNPIAVAAYGEAEFWFASIKVIAIVSLIVGGLLAIIFELGAAGKHGGLFSPFVQAFTGIGVAGAGGLMNFVVLTSALSACSSGLFSNSRLLKGLAADGLAPARLQVVSNRRVPARAIIASGAFRLIGVVVNLEVPKQAFACISSVATLGAIWSWGIIIGAGRVGGRMAKRLLEAGYPIVVFEPSTDAVAALVRHGATAASSLAEAAVSARLILTSLPNAAFLRQTWTGGVGAGQVTKLCNIVLGEVLVTGVEARRETQPADTGARGMNAISGVIPRVTVTGEHAEAVRGAVLVIRTSSERRAVAT